MSSDYAMGFGDVFSVHGQSFTSRLHDGLRSKPDVDSAVLSGDYFVTLATKLNMIATFLEMKHNTEATEINEIIQDLFYLDQKYEIIKK